MNKSPVSYREMWERKPALREVYNDMYRRMAVSSVPGPTLELGGGSGNYKDFAPDVISSDILPAPWLDLVCDAQRLPCADKSFANIVMVDVVHHLESPVLLFREAERVLRPGGRLIFCEPAMTPVSGLIYRNFHDERVDCSVDPLDVVEISNKDPYDGNQAIPAMLVGSHREGLARMVPRLALLRLDWFSFVAYPLTGGLLRPWCLLPKALARPLLELEWRSRKILGRLAAFRLIAVYRKTD